MSLIAFLLDYNKVSLKYIQDFIKKTKSEDMIKNPFIVKHRFDVNSNEVFYLGSISPVYPRVDLFGYMMLSIILLFWGFSFWLILPLAIISVGFFYSRPFYILMFYIGLKKTGYDGRFKVLSKTNIIYQLTKWHK